MNLAFFCLGYSHAFQNFLTFILLPQLFSFLDQEAFLHCHTVAVPPLLSPMGMDSFFPSHFLMGRMLELRVLTCKYKRKGCEKSTGLLFLCVTLQQVPVKENEQTLPLFCHCTFFSQVLKQKDKTLLP